MRLLLGLGEGGHWPAAIKAVAEWFPVEERAVGMGIVNTNNVQTIPSDIFPTSLVASISGLAGTGAGLGAMLFTLLTGWTVDHFGYVPILAVSGLLMPLATAMLFLFEKKMEAEGKVTPA